MNTDVNVFINNYQVNLGGWILQLDKNPLVKNTPPIPLNVSWGGGGRILHNIPPPLQGIIVNCSRVTENP